MREIIVLLGAIVLVITTHCAYAKDIITISVFEDHERYVAASNSYGISWLLLEKAADDAGIELVVVESSWRASMSRINANRIDMVFAALKTEERKRNFNFTLPLVTEGSGIFTKTNNPVSSFEEIDLQKDIIGVSANSLQETLAQNLGFENIYATVQRPQLYDMLNGGRVDYLFFGKSIIDYYCKYYDSSKKRNCMKQVGPSYHPNNVHAIVLKDNEYANKVLQKINKNLFDERQSQATKDLFSRYELASDAYAMWLKTLREYQDEN